MAQKPPLDLEEALLVLEQHAPPLAKALALRPELAKGLFQADALDQPLAEADLARLLARPQEGPESEEALMSRLRRAKEAVFVHLALRDLWGLASLDEVFLTLSGLARLALAEALAGGLDLLLARRGLEPWPDDRPLPFCVLGLGKLGGLELNYSSDVDLIYLQQPALWPHQARVDAAEFAAALGALISRALGQATAEGLVFRVDLDLRPAGKDGPMVPSLDMARHHYLYRAAEWERLALIKLRPLAGNLDLGRELIEETRPFVFRRHLDYTALDELKALKARFSTRPRSRTQSGQDLKLDRGGIRQLEFFVQTLQLIFGGRKPKLRPPGTLAALAALAGEEIISRPDTSELGAAYVFLRRAEHRLQLHGLRQTQSLPAGKEALDRLGRAMGYGEPTPGRDFLDDLASHTEAVSRRFESLLQEPGPVKDSRPLARLLEVMEREDREASLDLLATLGFLEPERALESIGKLTADSFLPHSLARQRQLLARVLPAMLHQVLASAEPDAALFRLEAFLARMGPKTGLFLLLLENPPVLEMLVGLLASSAFLARVLTAHPGILDGLIDPRSLRVKDREELARELDQALAAAGDVEDKAGLIRRFKAEETVRIAVTDLTEELGLERVSDQLSDLAEVVLGQTLELAREILAPRYPEQAAGQGLEFVVIALGKLGGRELAYHADLDVIFLYRNLDPAPGAAPRAGEYAAKLAQRVISLLSVSMIEGPGYQIDARLRPSGRYGPLVASLDSFAKYHAASPVWERLVLLKARLVAGSEKLGREVLAAVDRAVFERELPDGWAGELRELRERMARERGAASGFDLKLARGGLVDVEFATQALQIKHGRELNRLRTPHTLRALKALEEAGLLDRTDQAALFDGYRYLRRLDHRLRLLFDRRGDGVSYGEEEIRKAGRRPEELAGIMAGVARAYETVMEGL